MVEAKGWGRGLGSCCLMGKEFQFCKKKRVLETYVVIVVHQYVFNITELYT